MKEQSKMSLNITFCKLVSGTNELIHLRMEQDDGYHSRDKFNNNFVEEKANFGKTFMIRNTIIKALIDGNSASSSWFYGVLNYAYCPCVYGHWMEVFCVLTVTSDLSIYSIIQPLFKFRRRFVIYLFVLFSYNLRRSPILCAELCYKI